MTRSFYCLPSIARAWIVALACVILLIATAPLVQAQQPSGDISGSTPTSSVCEGGVSSDIGGSSVCQGANQANDATNDPVLGPNSILGRIVQIVIFLVGALSVIMVIVGGFRYVISGGDSNGTKAAKDTILYALIGLVIAIFAQGLVSLVLTQSIF